MAQNNKSHFLSSRICNLDRAQSGKLISAPQRLWSQLRRLEDEGVTARGHHMRACSLTCPAVEAASQRGPELGHFVAFWWGLAFLRARRLCSQMSSQDKEPGGSGATFGPSLYRIITPRLPSSIHSLNHSLINIWQVACYVQGTLYLQYQNNKKKISALVAFTCQQRR